ncbi:MAG: hypothetical protein ACJ0GJ_00965 [Candidatus Actinomarina sp.]
MLEKNEDIFGDKEIERLKEAARGNEEEKFAWYRYSKNMKNLSRP